MSTDAHALAAAACEDEPIRVPGSIQPHGVLLALDPVTARVVITSAGATTLLGRCAELGSDLAELGDLRALVASVAQGEDHGGAPTTITLPGVATQNALAHLVDGLVVVELEPAIGDEGDRPWHLNLPSALRRLQEARSLLQMSDALAASVRRLTGFDRVMVYRFDDAWNGEVVSEDRREDLEPFLGLHYPASDIPAQARALYEKQWLRIIPDTTYSPVPLHPGVVPSTGAPLDLSLAVLRSVSPVHLKYLHNMGVASSMSISLLLGGRLWGLIACHHYAGPHRPAQTVRSAAEFLGRTASLLLPTVTGLDAYADVLASSRARSRLTEALGEHPGMAVDALTRDEVTIADLVPCGGAAMRLHGELRLLGTTPSATEVAQLLARLGPQALVTSTLSAQMSDLAHLSASASGVLAAPIEGGQPGDALVWFRPEVLREVTWGGDPRSSKVLVNEGGSVRLDPRASFDAWSETVRETAHRWMPHEVEAAVEFARHLSGTMLREVERTHRLATALQQTLLLEKLPDIPGLDLAARYSPHSDDVVGGDWYDIIVLPSGARAAVIGDVAGHGLAVSAISAQMRNALRACLLSAQDPGQALGRLNDLVVALMPGELATAVIVVTDPDTGHTLAASAGHPPLLHLHSGVATMVNEGGGPSLGLLEGATYPSTGFVLDRDDVVLLYSDGLVETREDSLDDRLALLRARALEPFDDLEVLCDRLLSTLPAHSDDTTLLALRRT